MDSGRRRPYYAYGTGTSCLAHLRRTRSCFVAVTALVCLTGPDGSNRIDTAMVLDLGTESELFPSLGDLDLGGDFSAEVFERVLWIASRIAAEGREGRPIGTIFVLGDALEVLAQTRQLVLNPLQGHPESGRNVLSLELEETIKEFATIDGAFIVRGDGVVLAAGVQLQAKPSKLLDLPAGLGTRHAAGRGHHGLDGRRRVRDFAVHKDRHGVQVRTYPHPDPAFRGASRGARALALLIQKVVSLAGNRRHSGDGIPAGS